MMKPLGPEWVEGSITRLYEYALCRDDHGDGKVYLCMLRDEAKGWEPQHEATSLDYAAFRFSQQMRKEQAG